MDVGGNIISQQSKARKNHLKTQYTINKQSLSMHMHIWTLKHEFTMNFLLLEKLKKEWKEQAMTQDHFELKIISKQSTNKTLNCGTRCY